MADQLGPTFELIFDIIKNTGFFLLIYGAKAVSAASSLLFETVHDDAWVQKLGLSILIILSSFYALRMAYRGLMWWISFIFNFAIVLGAIGVMVWFWSRGPEGVWEDGKLIADFWMGQYKQYEAQARGGKAIYDYVQGARDAIVNERQRAERIQGGRGRYW